MAELEDGWRKRIDLIKKLDEKRWILYQDESDIDDLEGLSASEKILTHWITYVTDRMIKVKTKDKNKNMWKKALPVFASWVKYYTKNGDIEKLEKFWSEKKGFVSLDNGDNFKPRFPKKDKKTILRTFSILDRMKENRNLIKFLAERFDIFKNDEDVIRRIVCYLFLLTYETKYDEGKTIALISNPAEFEKYYIRWTKEKTQNKKRLWAAFRDYIKPGKLKKYFIESISEIDRKDLIPYWEKFGKEFKYLNQLELPGDVWNKKSTFTKAFLAPLIMKLDTETFRLEDVSQVAREICDELNKKYDAQIYPEMLDFTFEDSLREEFLEKFPYKGIRIELMR